MIKGFENLLIKLGKEISEPIIYFCPDFDKILEIRITANNPVLIITYDKLINTEKIVTLSEIRNIFASLCEFSVHAYKNEICRGFITIEGGIRIGLCGTALYDNEKISGIKDVSSLNIRIPHEIFGSSEKIIPFLEHGNILIVGPPCSGKTTVLRDVARKYSLNHHTVIIDERGELAGTNHGEVSFDIGNSSVLNNFQKKDGLEFAVRSMSPELIICDEFGGEEDIRSAIFAIKSGAKIAASAHAFDKKDFSDKPFTEKIIEHKLFSYFVFMDKNFEIKEIVSAEELLL